MGSQESVRPEKQPRGKKAEGRSTEFRIFILWTMWPVMVLYRWVVDAKQEFRKMNLVTV